MEEAGVNPDPLLDLLVNPDERRPALPGLISSCRIKEVAVLGKRADLRAERLVDELRLRAQAPSRLIMPLVDESHALILNLIIVWGSLPDTHQNDTVRRGELVIHTPLE